MDKIVKKSRSNSSKISKYSLKRSSPNNTIDVVYGNPWTVVKIKTRLYAKDTTEIELSNRKITNLINFDDFENLEALWLNNNRLKYLNNLDKNFRIKQLYLSCNRLVSLEGSISVMKFLNELFLDNNKLRNLDLQLSYLKELPFLKNLSLFGNPLSEEPEYRNRVIFNIYSLEVFDRHKISGLEKTKAEKIVLEYMDPLRSVKGKDKSNSNTLNNSSNTDEMKKIKIKKPILHSQKILMTISLSGMKSLPYDPNKHLKQYEKMSITEKEMFIEADKILKKNNEKEIKKNTVKLPENEQEKIINLIKELPQIENNNITKVSSKIEGNENIRDIDKDKNKGKNSIFQNNVQNSNINNPQNSYKGLDKELKEKISYLKDFHQFDNKIQVKEIKNIFNIQETSKILY